MKRILTSQSNHDSFRKFVLCISSAACLSLVVGCGGAEPGAVADQDEMARYLEQNPELKNTNSEEPDTSQEVAPRTVPEGV